jgi:hypothetical protein
MITFQRPISNFLKKNFLLIARFHFQENFAIQVCDYSIKGKLLIISVFLIKFVILKLLMLFFHFHLLGLFGLLGAYLAPKILSGKDQIITNGPSLPEEPLSKCFHLFYKDLSDSGRGFFSLFSRIYAEIKNDHSYKISSGDFDEINKFYSSESHEFMTIIRELHDRKLVLFACLLLSEAVNYYDYAEWLFVSKFYDYNRTTGKIFEVFNQLIGKLFMNPYPNSNIEEKEKLLIERKETAMIMVLILEEISNSKSNSKHKISFSFTSRIFFTRDYIRIMKNFINRIILDPLAGAQVVNFQLKQFHKKNSGKITAVEPFQEEVYTLLILWRLYARHIIRHEYKNIFVEDLDPIFLAQLIETFYARNLEAIFRVFEVGIVSNAMISLYYAEVINIPSSCMDYKVRGRKISNIGRALSFLTLKKENEQENTCWKLEAFIKLSLSR